MLVNGTITIAALIVLGIFVYPWLIRRGVFGRVIVAVATLGLAALYYAFDAANPSAPFRIGMAFLLAVAPLVTGFITVHVSK